MPTAPPIACPCGGRRINGKCDRCGPRTRQHDKQRGTAAERGYDYQWQRFRKRYLSEHPLCVDCEGLGVVAAATDVHHVTKLRDRPDLKCDETNLMGLCKFHHDKRTARGE